MNDDRIGVLFVCLGNICRSPLAEALFWKAVSEAKLEDRFEIDSAGTSGYHQGEPPDERTTEVARRRGVAVSGRSRPVDESDVVRFDYLVVMDASNLAEVERLVARASAAPRVVRLREFDPEADGQLDVPDPYYGGSRGFEDVHELVERSTLALLEHIRAAHGL